MLHLAFEKFGGDDAIAVPKETGSHTVVAGVGLWGPLLCSHFRLVVFPSPKEQLNSRKDLKPLLLSKPLRNLPVCRQLDSRRERGVLGRAAKGSEVPY